MAATDVQLTDGAVTAIARLKGGDKLERERNRSKVTWTKDGETLHHLTFKNLESVGAIEKVEGRSGYDTFGLTAKGRKLAK